MAYDDCSFLIYFLVEVYKQSLFGNHFV